MKMTREKKQQPNRNKRYEWQNFQSYSRGLTHQKRSAGISEFFASKYMLNVLHNFVSFSTLLLSFHFQLIYFALLLLLLYFGLFYSVYKCLTLTIALSTLLIASMGLSYSTNFLFDISFFFFHAIIVISAWFWKLIRKSMPFLGIVQISRTTSICTFVDTYCRSTWRWICQPN